MSAKQIPDFITFSGAFVQMWSIKEILLELVYPLYVTIGGSLDISLGNDPAFLEGHFVRVEPVEVIIMSA